MFSRSCHSSVNILIQMRIFKCAVTLRIVWLNNNDSFDRGSLNIAACHLAASKVLL